MKTSINSSMMWTVTLAITFLSHSLTAHPPDGKGHHHDDDRANVPRFPEALVLPAIDGPTPWSDKPILNDPNRFHIAIMTDRNGGHRPGIWMKAVKRLNLLRPQFVMSIGDLIAGYSKDREQLETEWKEFLGTVDKMQMKFFFVAGNHDLSNPVMHRIWREKFGPEWYSFDFKGVHFVCLCSEDPSNKIGNEQLAWIEDDLKKHHAVRWTLVFVHKPLWTYAEREIAAGNPDNTNWKQVEKLLGDRPHTVFSGHVHHYVQYDRNGMKYYHLGTTGGGSPLRGIPYGEFDHVVWLTMEKNGPYITNLLLDGMLPPNVVTEKEIVRLRSFLSTTALEVAPILIDDASGLSQGRIAVRLRNGFDAKVQVTGQIGGLPLHGLTVDPVFLNLSADPGQTAELAVQFKFDEKISFPHLAQTLFIAKLKTIEENPLVAERLIPVVIDHKYPCPLRTQAVAVDGMLGDWDELSQSTSETPLLLGETQLWQGPGDASLSFDVAHDQKFLYVAARVVDDRVVSGDRLQLRLDARSISVRLGNSQRLWQGTYHFTIDAPDEDGNTKLNVKAAYRKTLPGTKVAARRTNSGYDVEVAIPIEFVISARQPDVMKIYHNPLRQQEVAIPTEFVPENQENQWQTFQFTPVVDDVDEPDQPSCSIVWRGTRDVHRRNTNYGHFVRSE